ncbi:unnamed protein product [Citrullus colocynthis]|uniref:SAM domain-containing protein n=1 Tax=Citrullus colocynthis TaxID=252529 RepID=A0ABP0XXA9_9ROSI
MTFLRMSFHLFCELIMLHFPLGSLIITFADSVNTYVLRMENKEPWRSYSPFISSSGLTQVINAKLDRILCTSDMAKLETMEEEGLRIGTLRRHLTAAKLELKGQI